MFLFHKMSKSHIMYVISKVHACYAKYGLSSLRTGLFQPAAQIAPIYRHIISVLKWRRISHESDGAGGNWILGLSPGSL